MEKIYIGIYGAVNSGKSSLINRLCGQDIAIVSPVRGTTTDPVKKLIEIDGIGPCVLIDTAGIDDATALGTTRIAKTLQTLDIIDIAILVINNEPAPQDIELLNKLKALKKPFVIVNNKADLPSYKPFNFEGAQVLPFSALGGDVKPLLAALKPLKTKGLGRVLLDDIIKEGDSIVLVVPIDSAAPHGRLIQPQVNTLRNILDNKAIATVLQPQQLAGYLASCPKKPRLVITDSQAFKEVAAIVPQDIPLTGFSILFARFKGNFDAYLKGARAINNLKEGDKVLILESCSHSAITCEDIGRVKLPKLIEKKSGQKLNFTIIPNLEQLPSDLGAYALAVQCGGCMVTAAQLAARIGKIQAQNIPVTNYGMAIAYCTGIFERAVKPFILPEETRCVSLF